jgi:hypothetical protein
MMTPWSMQDLVQQKLQIIYDADTLDGLLAFLRLKHLLLLDC